MDPSAIAEKPEVPQWEREEGVPQFADPFIQKYLSGRDALIDQEQSRRSDYSFRQSLTPLAREACRIVKRIRREEHETILKHESTNDSTGTNESLAYPGAMYAFVKDKARTTKTWQILRKMPKGALLHCHLDAMVDMEWLVSEMLHTNGMCMTSDQPLTTEKARNEANIRFHFKHQSTGEGKLIWTDSWDPSVTVSAKEAADSFPEGGVAGFQIWLISRLTISAEEASRQHYGQDHIWRNFVSCFAVIESILFYGPIFRAALQHVLRGLVADGVSWVEFRLAFGFKYYQKELETPCEGYGDFFDAFDEEVEKFRATPEGKSFWGCRFIWTAVRLLDKKAIIDNMKDCIEIKLAFPDLLAGYDLVGQEDLGRPLADLTPELFWFKKRCAEEGVDIPFYFHAGETVGNGNEADKNLYDAILLGTRRIGHAFSLSKHPLLIDMVKQKRILVESCPISNEVLRLTGSIKSHTLPALLAQGVSASLSNDDPTILGHDSNGLTPDFWHAFHGWDNLGLHGLASLAENSVRYAAFEPDVDAKEWIKEIKDGINGQGLRAERMRQWTREWNKFCEWVVKEYAIDYGADDDDEDDV